MAKMPVAETPLITHNWSGRYLSLALAVLAFLAMAASPAVAQETLASVRQHGTIRCGVSQGLPGFSAQDATGGWTGFDVDLCRALASAIFDDPSKVTFVPLSAKDQFVPLVSGTIDVLSRNTTWTLAREAGLGIQFATVTYYDSQGFLVHKSRGVTSATQLNGTNICVQNGTTNQLNLADYFRNNNMDYHEVALDTAADAVKAYTDGRCDALASDVSQLYAVRVLMQSPDDQVILPDTISKEPLGPAVRNGDDRWLNVVKWTHYAMVNAEELGVGQQTIDQQMSSQKAAVRRLLGTYAAMGEALGLTNDWALRIIRHVGNYGEVFERNLGSGSPLAIPRGLNRLWRDGGIQYAPPIL